MPQSDAQIESRPLRWGKLCAVAAALFGVLITSTAARAGGLSLTVTRVEASRREGAAYFDTRLGKAITKKLASAGLVYTHFVFRSAVISEHAVGIVQFPACLQCGIV